MITYMKLTMRRMVEMLLCPPAPRSPSFVNTPPKQQGGGVYLQTLSRR